MNATNTRKNRTRTLLLAVLVPSLFVLPNCVTKGFHEQTVRDLKSKHHQALAARTKQLEAQETALINKNKALVMRINKLRNRCNRYLHKMSNKHNLKAQRLRKAMQYINRLETQLTSWQRLHARLTRRFRVKIQEGTLAVKYEDGRIVLRLPEKVLFESGNAQLTTSGKQMIAYVAQALSKEPYQWQVAGHADSTGSAQVNWTLSHQRAMAVLKVMLNSDMQPQKLSAAAYGHYQPRASNETSAGRALNRRTEIVFIPKIKALLLDKMEKKLSSMCTPNTNQKAS